MSKIEKIKLTNRAVGVNPNLYDDPKDAILMDLLEIVDSIGHDKIYFTLDWSDKESHKLFKDYLVRLHGEEIKKHKEFVLLCC